jgi:pimeloyl-ACP methyl ester carboxylesterase
MKILIDRQLVEYKREGQGKTVVLLHGWGASLATFDELAKYLTGRGFEVIRFDFPGFGGSPKPDDSWGVGEYAGLTAALLQKLKVKSVYALIGHSFGGRVIIKGISAKQLNPKKVVLLGAAGVKPRQTGKKLAYKAVAKVGKVLTSVPGLRSAQGRLREKLYATAGATDYLNAGSMRKVFLNTINEDLLGDVSHVLQPTLLVWGENDTETPLYQARLIKERLKTGELVVVPEAGHFVYTDDSAAVMRELDRFL